MSGSGSSLRERIWKRLTLRDDLTEFSEYQTTWLLRLCRRLHEAVILMLVRVPPLYEAFVIRSERRARLRATVQFSFGLFLGLIFYLCVLRDLQVNEEFANMVGIFISVFLAVGNVVSSQIRCISLLVPIRFGTVTGRNIMLGLLISYLTAGPITNITVNLHETLRIIMCQSWKVFTLTKNRFQLMFEPFGKAIIKSQAHTEETEALLLTVSDAYRSVEEELVDETELLEFKKNMDKWDRDWGQTLRSEVIDNNLKVLPNDDLTTRVLKTYTKKLTYRCENLVTETSKKCKDIFATLQKECEEYLYFDALKFICEVLNILNICNWRALFGDADMCNPKNIVPHNIGIHFSRLKDYKNKLKSAFKMPHLHLNISKVAKDAKQTAYDIHQTARGIDSEYEMKKGFLQSITSLVTKIAAFAFIFIILSCHYYIADYLTDVEAHNTYVTWYFRKIDYRRYSKGKLTLLPLKSSEKRELSDVYEFRMTVHEKWELIYAIIIIVLMLFFTLIFMKVDNILYNILIDYRNQALITYEQSGHHDLSLEIKGVGLLASILRSITNNFVINEQLKLSFTNEECLPRPYEPGEYSFRIFTIFVLLFVLAWMNALVMKKMSRYVCSLFYPKVEKKRIIFLYNQTLRKRITYLNYRLDMIKRQPREKKIEIVSTFPMLLRLKHPKLFFWLLYLNRGRRSCIICHEPEPKSGGENRCISINCYLYYDQQCWDFVVKRNCIGCPTYTDETELFNAV